MKDDRVDCRSSKVISDITLISNRTSQPPLLCLAQYFGVEDDLKDGLREVQPLIIYPFALPFSLGMFLVAIHLIIFIRRMSIVIKIIEY